MRLTGSDSFATFNATEWQAGNWLNGWNGEFHFYTGAPSNRSRNLFTENGTLFLQVLLWMGYSVMSVCIPVTKAVTNTHTHTHTHALTRTYSHSISSQT